MPTDVGSAVGYLDLDISGFLAGLQSAQSQANKTGMSLSSAWSKVGSGIQSTGKVLTASVTAPIVGMGTAIVGTSSKFESQMSKVSAISGATGKTLDKLKEKAMEMGAKTKFSATEAGQAMEYMGMAGWNDQQMVDGLAGIMNLAAASGEDLGTTSDIVTDALTAFGLAASDSSRFADVLAKTSTKTNTNVSMLGESFKYVAPLCGTLGYSAEDSATALGTMANSGIKASQAGTTLKTSLANLAKPTDDQASLMEELGISMTNSDGSMKSLKEVIDNLRGSMSGLSKDQQASAAATLFGKEAMSGMLAVVNTAQSDYDSLSESIYNCDGTAENMANTMNDNLNGQFTILKSTLETIALQFGDILLPIIKKFVAKLQEFATYLTNLNDSQRETIARIAVVAAAIGPILLLVGTFITQMVKLSEHIKIMKDVFKAFGLGITHIKEAFDLARAGMTGFASQTSMIGTVLGTAGAPILAIVAAVALLVAAFKHLWDTNTAFKENITNTWNQIKETLSGFIDGIKERMSGIVVVFQNIVDVIGSIWDGFCNLLAPLFEGAFSNIASILQGICDVILGIVDIFIGVFTGDWDTAWQGVQEVFGGIWGTVVSIFQNVVDTIHGVADVILGWFGTDWNSTWQGISDFFVGIWTSLGDFFTNLWDGITSFFTSTGESVSTGWTTLWQGIYDFFINIWNAISTFFVNIVTGITTTIQAYFGDFFTAIQGIFQGISDYFGSIWEIIKNIFLGAILLIIDLFTGNFTQLEEDAQNIWNNITDAVTNMWSAIQSIFTNVINAIVSFAVGTFNMMKDGIANIWTNIKNTSINLWNGLKDGICNIASAIYNGVVNAFNNAKNAVINAGENIKNGATNAFNAMRNGIANACGNVYNTVVNGFNGAISFIRNLPSQALSWGKDMIDGFVNGIKNTMHKVTDAVKGVGNKIRSFLHFSVPDEGPLTDYESWMPDMITGLSKTLTGASGKLQTAASKVAGKVSTELSDINTSDVTVETEDTFKSSLTRMSDYLKQVKEQMLSTYTEIKGVIYEIGKASKEITMSDGDIKLTDVLNKKDKPSGDSDDGVEPDMDKPSGGPTYIFNSQAKLSEVECRHEMEQAQRELALDL